MMQKPLDINCDLGEGGAFDEAIMPLISSCNIACGGHYGDKASVQEAMNLAQKSAVLVGAHPSYPDQLNFGRKSLKISSKDLFDSITHQLNLFFELAEKQKIKVNHIKPHGALYHDVAQKVEIAEVFFEAVSVYQNNLVVFTSPNSILTSYKSLRNRIYTEVFADRMYKDNGDLVSRSCPNSVLISPHEVSQQVLQLVKHNKVKTLNGNWLKLPFDTICFHSDTPNAVENLKYTHHSLTEAGFQIHQQDA